MQLGHIRPGIVDLGKSTRVDEPLKSDDSDQVGFRWRHRQIQQAQLQLVLCRVELKYKNSLRTIYIYVPANAYIRVNSNVSTSAVSRESCD